MFREARKGLLSGPHFPRHRVSLPLNAHFGIARHAEFMFLMIGETVLQMIIARQQVASTGERFTMGDLEAIFSDIDNNLPDNRLVESELLEAVPYLTRLGFRSPDVAAVLAFDVDQSGTLEFEEFVPWAVEIHCPDTAQTTAQTLPLDWRHFVAWVGHDLDPTPHTIHPSLLTHPSHLPPGGAGPGRPPRPPRPRRLPHRRVPHVLAPRGRAGRVGPRLLVRAHQAAPPLARRQADRLPGALRAQGGRGVPRRDRRQAQPARRDRRRFRRRGP
mmetsp:Transcript_35964/g.115697  ORF Transcript_35964/g.115697 Transcript_35964/m.115697 type:complete len:273 (-) Transcript_35964:549-1367(-)